MVGGTQGTPQPGLDGGGYPGYPLDQVWMVRGTWGIPLTRSGWQGVSRIPPTRSGWWGVTGVPPDLRWGTPQTQTQDGVSPYLDLGWATPLPRPEMGYPAPPYTEQHSEHLLRGGRCASCVHAGGLSCFNEQTHRFTYKRIDSPQVLYLSRDHLITRNRLFWKVSLLCDAQNFSFQLFSPRNLRCWVNCQTVINITKKRTQRVNGA